MIDNKPFCSAPWTTIQHGSVLHQGGTCPCCEWNGTVYKNGIKQYLESDWLHSVKETMQSHDMDIINSTCKSCLELEKLGLRSKRNIVDDWIKSDTLEFGKIGLVDYRASNLCNLKCRMCGPWSSNQWAREYYDTRYKDKISWEEFLSDNQQYSSLYDTESYFWENIHSILKDVVHLDFYGGEPFLIKKHWDLIEQCVNNGYSQNKTLHYTTNATIWPEKYIHLLKNFNCVYINLSLDAIQDKANYIRYPSKWEEVDVIVNKWYVFAMNHPNIHINICYTVTPYNVYYVDEMIQYLESLNKKYESNMIDLKDIFLNTVHKPNYYDIRFMPLYLKENIFSKLEQGAEKNKPLNNLLNYMMSESYNKNYWNQFKYYTKMSDEYRNQSFQKIFPELYSLIFNKEVF